MHPLAAFLPILLFTTSLWVRPRTVFFEKELMTAKFVGTVVIDRYHYDKPNEKGYVYFRSIEYPDTISQAYSLTYGKDGKRGSLEHEGYLTNALPFKNDTALIVIDSTGRVSLFAKIEKDRYRFWSPRDTRSAALFRFNKPAEILNEEMEIKNERPVPGRPSLACWDGCYLKKEYLRGYIDNKIPGYKAGME